MTNSIQFLKGSKQISVELMENKCVRHQLFTAPQKSIRVTLKFTEFSCKVDENVKQRLSLAFYPIYILDNHQSLGIKMCS